MEETKAEYENELEVKKNDNGEQRAIWESSHRFLTDRFQQVQAEQYIIVSENVFALVKVYTLCFPDMINEIGTGTSKEYIIKMIIRKFLYNQYTTSESSEIIKNFIFPFNYSQIISKRNINKIYSKCNNTYVFSYDII